MAFRTSIKTIISLTFLLSVSLTIAQNAVAQSCAEVYSTENLNEKYLITYAKAYKTMRQISQEAQLEMIQKVKFVGLTIERYNDIVREAQNPNATISTTATENRQIIEIERDLLIIQAETQIKINEGIEAVGMSMGCYQKIGLLIQSDPKLMERVENIINQG